MFKPKPTEEREYRHYGRVNVVFYALGDSYMVISMEFLGFIAFCVFLGWIPIAVIVGVIIMIGGRWSE